MAAELPLFVVEPFNCFIRYVLFDCIGSMNIYNNKRYMYHMRNVGLKLFLKAKSCISQSADLNLQKTIISDCPYLFQL